jgi:tetratricopeptide (TPR) repeat protein
VGLAIISPSKMSFPWDDTVHSRVVYSHPHPIFEVNMIPTHAGRGTPLWQVTTPIPRLRIRHPDQEQRRRFLPSWRFLWPHLLILSVCFLPAQAPALPLPMAPAEQVLAQSLTWRELFERGSARFRAGDYRGALSDFNRVLAAQPGLELGWFNRGSTRIKLGDNQGGVADYSQVLLINPGNSNALMLRASARYDLGDRKGSCQDLKRAVSLGNSSAKRAISSPLFTWCLNIPPQQ